MSNRLNVYDSSTAAALTVQLGMDENSEQPVEIWVKSSAAATFNILGSANGTRLTADAAIADDFIVVADFEDIAAGDTIYIGGESKVVDRLVDAQKRIYLTVALTAAPSTCATSGRTCGACMAPGHRSRRRSCGPAPLCLIPTRTPSSWSP